LRGEGERESANAEPGDEARHRIAELGDDRDHCEDPERRFDDAGTERDDRARSVVTLPPRGHFDDVREEVDRSQQRPEERDEQRRSEHAGDETVR
jgi:hypothetical protein